MTPTLLIQADRAAVYFRAARAGHKRSHERYLTAKQLRNRDLISDVRAMGKSVPRKIERALT